MSMGQEISYPHSFQRPLVHLTRRFSLSSMPLQCVIQLPSPLVIELPLKGSIVIIKIMKKNKGHHACFCSRAVDSVHHLCFLQLGRVSKRHVRGRWKKALKNSILWNLHRGKVIRT